jgi:hypothetical protein
MKTWKHCVFVGVLAILVILGSFGCSGNSLNGTWEDEISRMAIVISGDKITWIHGIEGPSPTYTYSISDGELKLSMSDGSLGGVPFSRKGNTITIGGMEFTRKGSQKTGSASSGTTRVSRITEKNMVGVWELEDVANVSRREVSDKDEFFNDGTGIMSKGNEHMSFTWRLRDGNRLQIDADGAGTEISEIELSENGRLLTYYMDSDRLKKAMYRKKIK